MSNHLRQYIITLGFLIFCIVCPSYGISAQELNCEVTINTDQIQRTDGSIFQTLQQAITEYLNENHFTNDQYATNERIDCRLFFTIAEFTDNTLKGDLQIQSSRPVYNSNLTTTLFNFKDNKIEFTYQEGEPLNLNFNAMESQLTAILNFYAYLIIAIDRDSFSPRGGDDAWERVKVVVQQAQSSGEGGWKAFEDKKNRAALLAAFTDPATNVTRDMLYQYHRTGLDEMFMSPDKGRAQITKSLEGLEKVYQADPMSVGLSLFKDAKLDELVSIYSGAPQTERQKVVDILAPLYPTDMKRINLIKQGKLKE